MPRTARLKGAECTYHIIIRGNNRQNIFNDDSDRDRFLNTIRKFKIKYEFLLYSYILMDNHVHLIIDSNGEDISKVMQSINISYTYYFNKKYNRIGHLFHDRFKSIIVDDDRYIINLSKYIHNNPVRAHMVDRAEDYKWSSAGLFTGKDVDTYMIVDQYFILCYYSDYWERAHMLYSKFLNSMDEDCQNGIIISDTKIDLYKKGKNHIDPRRVLEYALKLYNISMEDIIYSRIKGSSIIRHELFYIVRLKSRENIKSIVKVFGETNTCSVYYGINRTIERMMSDTDTYKRITDILIQLSDFGQKVN